MRKVFFVLLLLTTTAFAADWYADSGSGDISTRGWHATSAGSCAAGSGTALVWANRAAGDVFHANSCTAISIAADPGVGGSNVTLSTVTGTGAAGGGFTLNTSTGITCHCTIVSGTTQVLTLTGSSAGTPVVSILGTVTAGSAGAAFGVSDAHTVGTVQYTGNITAGSSTTTHGINSSGTGPITITGDAIGGSSTGDAVHSSGGAAISITGNCKGSDTGVSVGCYASAGSVITVTGNLIDGKAGAATFGAILWHPAATNYRLTATDSSYVLGTHDTHSIESVPDASTTIGTAGNVKNGLAYGTYTGTLTSGGASGSAQ